MSFAPGRQTDQALIRLPDGTVKQKNLLTGTEVWTVPGRGHRPLAVPPPDTTPIDQDKQGSFCAFCENRYLETPPEKSRVVHHGNPAVVSSEPNTPLHSPAAEDEHWRYLRDLSADDLSSSVAAFRRIPNLFEIVSFNYWRQNHHHQPSARSRLRMKQYLSSAAGRAHVQAVVTARLRASGLSEPQIADLDEAALWEQANGFFSGGHDVIVARRHYVAGATQCSQLASSGTLTPQEHAHYLNFTAQALGDLYDLDPAVQYVAAFQNWLRPAGASFDHLHKQLVAIDEPSVQTKAECERIDSNPRLYEEILQVGTIHDLLLAQNEHAVALAGFGHRYPTIAVWPLGPPRQPWEYTWEEMCGISDVLHAAHAATGAEVPCNEEWYHRPPAVSVPMRFRLLLKWRISTLAGFEGGTRIYLNTIDPWTLRARMLPRLLELREAGKIAPKLRIGSECAVSPEMLS